MRAQNDFLRPASALVLGFGAGAFSLEPVARLYFARPLAVRPAPDLVDSFSPRPTDSDTDFAITHPSKTLIRRFEYTTGARPLAYIRVKQREMQT